MRMATAVTAAAKRRERRDRRRFFLFVSPWIVGFLVFTLVPMLMSLYYSFTDWNVLNDASFVGLENYRELFHDDLFYKSLQVTGVYTAIVVPLDVVLSLLCAILLNTGMRGIGVFRVIYYLPAVLPGVVVAVLWQWIFNSKYGLMNSMLAFFGVDGPRWLSDSRWIMPALVIMNVWGLGTGIVMYLAGLKAAPEDLYRAARIDGAGWWARLFHVTLPSMSPIILFTFLTTMISTLQTFTSAYVMTAGGPNNGSLFYALYMYRQGFQYRHMGEACAMAWLLFLVILALSLLVLRVSRGVVHYGVEEAA